MQVTLDFFLLCRFLQLVQTAGVAAESIKFGTCSLQSDKYICVCQGGELVIVDMTAGNAVKRWPISAEAAIMNPTQKIVALRGEKHWYAQVSLTQENIVDTVWNRLSWVACLVCYYTPINFLSLHRQSIHEGRDLFSFFITSSQPSHAALLPGRNFKP